MLVISCSFPLERKSSLISCDFVISSLYHGHVREYIVVLMLIFLVSYFHHGSLRHGVYIFLKFLCFLKVTLSLIVMDSLIIAFDVQTFLCLIKLRF